MRSTQTTLVSIGATTMRSRLRKLVTNGSRSTNGITTQTGQLGKLHGLRLSPSWVRISPSPIMKEMILTEVNSAKNIVNGKIKSKQEEYISSCLRYGGSCLTDETSQQKG